MKVTINDGRASTDSIDNKIYTRLRAFEGRKAFLKLGGFTFEASRHNLDLFKAVYPAAEIEAEKNPAQAAGEAAGSELWEGAARLPYRQKTISYKHQEKALAVALSKPYSALFMEQGTGKTKVAIDTAGTRYRAGLITGVLVITKKGIHQQWVDEQIPTHLDESVERFAFAWNKKTIPDEILKTNNLKFFTINVDALRTDYGFDFAMDFIKAHRGRIMCIVDESQEIKSATTKRSKAARDLGKACAFRMIMSGTPIAKDLTDEWAQFLFLDESIIGHRYMTTFRSQYCIMGGFEGRMVVGHKNEQALYDKVAPYTFRITKEEELDLPPKNYAKEYFDLSPEQMKHYKSFKENFLTQLDSGEISSIANAAVLITRLQQIACGYLPLEDGEILKLPNPRLEAMKNVIEQRQGKIVIWARFNKDIESIMEALGNRAISYYGATKDVDRKIAREKFLDKDSGIDYFVSNPQAGGTGLNLQGECRTAIYYSNSYRAIDRWQSEDRIHRIGTVHTITYIDLIANKTVDNKILANLRSKKSLSDLMLDDLRRFVTVED